MGDPTEVLSRSEDFDIDGDVAMVMQVMYMMELGVQLIQAKQELMQVVRKSNDIWSL